MGKNALFRSLPLDRDIIERIESLGAGKLSKALHEKRKGEVRKRKTSLLRKAMMDMDDEEEARLTRHEELTKILFKKTRFKKAGSALKPEEFPDSQLPEIAFIGRSNVGKSMLLNRITNRFIAKSSDKPGRTQTLDFYRLGQYLMFVDLPGYGFAYANENKMMIWNETVRRERRNIPKSGIYIYIYKLP